MLFLLLLWEFDGHHLLVFKDMVNLLFWSDFSLLFVFYSSLQTPMVFVQILFITIDGKAEVFNLTLLYSNNWTFLYIQIFDVNGFR